MKLTILIYKNPEYYPPTLNAIQNLSDTFERIEVVYNNIGTMLWEYPENVTLIPIGDSVTENEAKKGSFIWKLRRFLSFILKTKKSLDKTDVVLLYDYMPVLSYIIASKISFKLKPILWYHGHDVIESKPKFGTLSWFAIKSQKSFFKYLDIFSLPADDRKKLYPIEVFKGEYFFLPNYPALYLYKDVIKKSKKSNMNIIKLLYQGRICEGHGLEEFIDILPYQINGKELQLHLAGPYGEDYKQSLLDKAKNLDVLHKIFFHGLLPYRELPKLTRSCNIGIATLIPISTNYATAATASNKIYEYAACGLPVLYYSTEHYIKYLSKYTWAFETNLSVDNLKNILSNIDINYHQFNKNAYDSFITSFNYEMAFCQLKHSLSSKVKSN